MNKCIQCKAPVYSEHAQVCDLCLLYKDLSPTYVDLTEVVQPILVKANMRPEYMHILLDKIYMYEKAFTSKEYNQFANYELLEFLGDSVVNSILTQYLYNKFPSFLYCRYGVKILSRLKSNYISKDSFSKIADKLGFFRYIRASESEKMRNKKGLLEDVFEAFIGTTTAIIDQTYSSPGVGYGVASAILKALFDDIHMSLAFEDMYDYKSILKQIFDRNRQYIGTHHYTDQPTSSTVYQVVGGQRTALGTGVGNPTKAERQQEAARQALAYFTKEKAVLINEHDRMIIACTQSTELNPQ